MSASKPRMMYTPALALAQDIVVNLRPACERIAIAGSLRRRKVDIGDIEIVCIPAPVLDDALPLFAAVEQHDSLESVLARLAATRGWETLKNGRRFKQYDIGITTLDLYITTPEQWGCIYIIRTGPYEFAKRLVTRKRLGGLCPSHLRFADGRIWSDMGQALDTPTEESVFRALGLEYIEPEERK